MRCRKFSVKSTHWCWLPSSQGILFQTIWHYISFHYAQIKALIDLSCSYKCLRLLCVRSQASVCYVGGKKKRKHNWSIMANWTGSHNAASWEESQLEIFDCFSVRQSILFLQSPAWISAQAGGTLWPETQCLMSLLTMWLWSYGKSKAAMPADHSYG